MFFIQFCSTTKNDKKNIFPRFFFFTNVLYIYYPLKTIINSNSSYKKVRQKRHLTFLKNFSFFLFWNNFIFNKQKKGIYFFLCKKHIKNLKKKYWIFSIYKHISTKKSIKKFLQRIFSQKILYWQKDLYIYKYTYLVP